MALSRLLLPKPGIQLHFHTIGLVKSTRWCSSSPSSSEGTDQSSHSKNPEVASEQRAVAKEPDVKKYVEMHPGLLPKAAQLQNKVGESWNALKGILTKFKVKMLGKPVQNQITSETSDSAFDRSAFEGKMRQNTPHDTGFGESKSKVWTNEALVDSNSGKECVSTYVEFHVTGESSSRDVVVATASESTKTSSCPSRTELGSSGPLSRSSGAIIYSLSTGKKFLENGPTNLIDEIASEDLDKLKAPEVTKVYISPDNIKIRETETTISSQEGFIDSHSDEGAAALKIGENSLEDQPKTKLDNGHKVLKETIPGMLGEVDKNQDSKAEHLTSLHQLAGEASRRSPKEGADGVASVGNGSYPIDKRTAPLVKILHADSDVGKVPASSYGALEVLGLSDLFMKTSNIQSAGEVPLEQMNFSTSNALSDFSDGIFGHDTVRGFDVKSLIDCIKELPGEELSVTSRENSICRNNGQINNTGSVKRTKTRVSKQDYDAKSASLENRFTGKESGKAKDTKEGPCVGFPLVQHSELCEDEQGSNLDCEASNDIKSKPIPRVPILSNTEDQDNTPSTDIIKERPIKNKILVRFLSIEAEESDIISAFEDCGDVVKIQQFSPVEGGFFKDAYVHFKTGKGLKEALKKTDLMIGKANVIVEAPSFVPDTTMISIPELIGDPDVPAALVKNPTRTVKIKQLAQDISSDQLQEALAFCNCGTSNFLLDSANSVAYVEFETEDAKERAIAEHSIYVSGKQLLIFRIDAPRTTVVRISNINGKIKGVQKKCNSYGEVKYIQQRGKDIVDVHFKLREWPHMLHILNSLNGMEVAGQRWVTQPAPIFPPEVIQALWGHPDERRHVIAAMYRLVQSIGDPIDTTYTKLTDKYYGGL